MTRCCHLWWTQLSAMLHAQGWTEVLHKQRGRFENLGLIVD
jgi:hypothetical protein